MAATSGCGDYSADPLGGKRPFSRLLVRPLSGIRAPACTCWKSWFTAGLSLWLSDSHLNNNTRWVFFIFLLCSETQFSKTLSHGPYFLPLTSPYLFTVLYSFLESQKDCGSFFLWDLGSLWPRHDNAEVHGAAIILGCRVNLCVWARGLTQRMWRKLSL